MTINVNGRDHVTDKVELTYADLVAIAHSPTNQSILYTVTYFHRAGSTSKLIGSLLPGEGVWLREGMIFNVALTGAA